MASHQPVVDWARAAVTRVAAAAPARGGAAPADDPPIVRAGTFDAYFPAIRLDRRLNQFTRSLIREDFPQYAADPVDNTDRVLAVVGAIRADTAHERAEAARDRATREARKTPAQKYPHSVRYMRRLAGLPDDGSQDVQLPELAHELANAKSSERRSCLQARFMLRASENGATTRVPPIATKEVLAMYEDGHSFAPTLYRLDDLLAGINPFTCGWRVGTEKGEIVHQRQVNFDAQQSGGTQVTLAEQQSLSTKEVQQPTSSWEATQMLGGLSICLDEFQGANHPHAYNFRVFLTGPWQEVVHGVESMSERDRAKVPHLWPCLLREVQLRMGRYLRMVLDGKGPADPPTYGEIRDMVLLRQWYQLATIPARYLVGPYQPPPAPGGTTPTPAPAPPGDASRVVMNTSRNETWITRYQDSGRTIAELRANAPRDNDNTELCLAYHLRGQCYSNCSRRGTHHAITGAALRRMNTFVNTHCAPTAPAATGTGGAGGPAPPATAGAAPGP